VGRKLSRKAYWFAGWISLSRATPDLSGGAGHKLSDNGVKASNGAEPGCIGNLIHRQARLINQFLGKMHAAGMGDRGAG
jgi:hypothetical protein